MRRKILKTLRLFFDSIFRFKDTLVAFYMTLKHKLVYILLLSLMMTLPAIQPSYQLLHTVRGNGPSIIQSIPDFTIENNQLVSEKDQAFINKTDFLNYVYNPKDQISQEDLKKIDSSALTIYTNPKNITFSFMGQQQSFPYADFSTDLDSQGQKQIIQSLTQFQPWVYLLVFLGIFLFNSLQVSLLALVIALFMAPMAITRKLQLTLGKRYNFALTAMTFPLVLIQLVHLFGYQVTFSFYIILFTALIRIWAFTKQIKVVKIDPKQWDANKDQVKNDKNLVNLDKQDEDTARGQKDDLDHTDKNDD